MIMVFDRRLNSLAFSLRRPFLIVTSSAIAGGLAIIAQAWILSDILNRVHMFHIGLEQAAPSLILFVLVIIARSGLVFINEQSSAYLSENIRANLREQMAVKILRLGPASIEQQKTGELAYVVTAAIDTLDAYFSQYLPQLVICAVLPVSILFIVFPLDFLSALILLVTAPLIPIFMILIGRTTETLTHRQYAAFSRMSAFFHDSLCGLRELKNLGRSADHASRLDRVSEAYRDATLKVLRISFLSALVLELAATLSVAVIAVQIGIRLMYGQMEFHQAFFFLVIAPEFYFPLRQLGARFHAAQNGIVAAKRIFSILDEPENGSGNFQVEISPGVLPVFPDKFEIQFDNISFAYPGRENDAVHRVSFSIHSGEKIAIIGLNGSGKSTLASLFLRFIQPQEGRILFNGRDIQSFHPDEWRAGIAYVSQQPALFNTSIRENLTITAPHASGGQLEKALQQAQLLATVKALPEGIDTRLGEDAFGLSGGQAQRLILARAFLKNTPILVLDEPGAHLDALLEDELERSISRLQQNRTSIVIAHRKQTACEATRILMMDQGRLIGSGPHGQLLQTCPQYARFYTGDGL